MARNKVKRVKTRGPTASKKDKLSPILAEQLHRVTLALIDLDRAVNVIEDTLGIERGKQDEKGGTDGPKGSGPAAAGDMDRQADSDES